MIRQTFLLVSTNFLLLLWMYILQRKTFLNIPQSIGKDRLFVTLLLVFCLFSFWGGDWYHYQTIFYYLDPEMTHLEPVYVWLMQESPTYLIFRLIVWGSALAMTIYAYKRLPINFSLLIGVFGLLFIIYFSYARVSLAFAAIFTGIVLMSIDVKWSILFKIVGLGLLLGSFYLHKSAIFGIAAVFVAYVYKRMGDRSLYLLLILFPVIIVGLRLYLQDYIMTISEEEEGTLEGYAESGLRYMEASGSEKGIAAKMLKFLERFPLYCIAYQSFILVRKHQLPESVRYICIYLFVLVLFSTAFAFDLGANTSILYSRFLRFAIVPAPVVLAYCIENLIFCKLSKVTLYLGLIGVFGRIMYIMYVRG